MPLSLSYLCGMAATVFIAVGLAIASVRWFHMCRPYDRNPMYYYPGRPFVVAVYLNSLLLLPYALNPDSPDAWYLARFYFLPVTLFHFTILLFAYFGNVMQWKKWHMPMVLISLPVLLCMLAAFVLAVIPGNQVGSIAPALSWSLLYVTGVIITGTCIAAAAVVLKWAKTFDSDDFSNPADFPVTTARRWVVLTAVNVVLCWVGAIAAGKGLMAIIMLLFASSSVLFIIMALHPHRSRAIEEKEESEAPAPKPARRAPSKKKQLETLAAVHTVIVEQKAYLDAHLTIQDVADRSGYSRSSLSGIFKSEYDGFFNYINQLRLQHVETYLQEHRGATLQEAAMESGFNSRQAYYAVKSRLNKD